MGLLYSLYSTHSTLLTLLYSLYSATRCSTKLYCSFPSSLAALLPSVRRAGWRCLPPATSSPPLDTQEEEWTGWWPGRLVLTLVDTWQRYPVRRSGQSCWWLWMFFMGRRSQIIFTLERMILELKECGCGTTLVLVFSFLPGVRVSQHLMLGTRTVVLLPSRIIRLS